MNIDTHKEIDRELCGTPLQVDVDFSRVEMRALERMAVDASGLTHGGFIFGLADHAAMIAVNHPNVVLGGADILFRKPVRTGEVVVAEARVTPGEGRKRVVRVSVTREEETVFTGEFICFILERHVLE
jgi:acyl-coenzyme A thioesterase PaaI-like protein